MEGLEKLKERLKDAEKEVQILEETIKALRRSDLGECIDGYHEKLVTWKDKVKQFKRSVNRWSRED